MCCLGPEDERLNLITQADDLLFYDCRNMGRICCSQIVFMFAIKERSFVYVIVAGSTP